MPRFVADFVLLCLFDNVAAEGCVVTVGEFSVTESGDSVAPLLPWFYLSVTYWKAAPLSAGFRVFC